MQNEYFRGVKTVAKVLKDFFLIKYPALKVKIILPGQKVILSNTSDLQIIFESRGQSDLSNVNTTNYANLPIEEISKLIIEKYAINFIAYTNDTDGTNIAYIIRNIITGVFNTQKALYEFQLNQIRVPYIGNVDDISSVEGAENLVRLQLEIQIFQAITITSTAEYYDDFSNIPTFKIIS